MTRGPSIRSAMAPALLFLILVWFWFESRVPHPQVDDAYISYRYARNLVEGHGLVYNVGERVEGYTNLLWTLLLAAGLALGGRATGVAYLLGMASGTALLVATYLYARAGVERSRRLIAVVAPALLLSWIGFPVWTLSGLETPLFAAACAAALAAEAYGRLGIATAAALVAGLTRPEGPLLAAVILGVNFFGALPPRRRKVLACALAYAAALAMLTIFRLYYYGSPVPNTFFAKVGMNVWLQGMGELGMFVFGSPLPLLVPAVWVAWRDRTCRVGVLWAVAMAVYIVSIGGDAFPHLRFWTPVYLVLAALAARALILQRQTLDDWIRELPLWTFVIASFVWSLISARAAVLVLVVLLVGALAGLWGRRARRTAAVSTVAGTVLAGVLLTAPWVDDATYAQWTTLAFRLTGRGAPVESNRRWRTAASLLFGARGALSRNDSLRTTLRSRRDHLRRAAESAQRIAERRERGEPIDLVAVVAIGKFGYDLRLPILDMLGLVDAQIARSPPHEPSRPVMWLAGHMRTNADYLFSRRPDYIFLQRAWSTPLRLPVHDDVWNHPALERDYEWDEEMKAYRRKDLAKGGG